METSWWCLNVLYYIINKNNFVSRCLSVMYYSGTDIEVVGR